MRSRTLVAVTLVALSGCAQIEAIFKPPPRPPVTPPPSRPASPSSTPSPLRPELSAEEEQRLAEDARRKIGQVERLLRELEGRPMKPPHQEMFLTAKDFLDQARRALAERDYPRAANLASKARTLSDDLAATTK